MLSISYLGCAAHLLPFHAEGLLFVRKTERFKNIILLFAGMQKNLRSDLGSERGRLFVGTEEGNVNFAFSRVSFPHGLKLLGMEMKNLSFLTFLRAYHHSLRHKSSGRRGLQWKKSLQGSICTQRRSPKRTKSSRLHRLAIPQICLRKERKTSSNSWESRFVSFFLILWFLLMHEESAFFVVVLKRDHLRLLRSTSDFSAATF